MKLFTASDLRDVVTRTPCHETGMADRDAHGATCQRGVDRAPTTVVVPLVRSFVHFHIHRTPGWSSTMTSASLRLPDSSVT